MKINTNLHALAAQNKQRQSTSALSTAIERLSSGLRINSAKDDAAGQAIANRMEVTIRANKQVSRNINDGISLTQTAEGGLDEINNLLQRSRQLAVQSANGTLTDPDRNSIHEEFVQLREEIDRISRQTEAFGKTPLAPLRDGPAEPPKLGDTPPVTEKFPINDGKPQTFTSGIVSVAYIPKDAEGIRLDMFDLGADDDIQLFTTSGKHLVGSPIKPDPDNGITADQVWTNNSVNLSNIKDLVLTESNGFKEGAIYDGSDLISGNKTEADMQFTGEINGMNFTYSGDGNNGEEYRDLDEYIEIDKVTEDLILLVVGRGAFQAKLSWDEMPTLEVKEPDPIPPPHSYPIEVVTSANYGDQARTLTVTPTPADSKSLGIHEVSLNCPELSRASLEKFDQALEKVNSYRSYYGATHNRFDSITASLATQTVDLEAARSRIQDADYAVEVSNMTRTQILQQAGTSVLAQANQVPQAVLTLLG